ncbi:MAG: LPS export ABC transporter periplasmic protein LptC [Pseudomonadota bacterium]
MSEKQQIFVLASIFVLLIGVSVWLQFGLLEDPRTELTEADKKDYDYYVLNFTSTGMDRFGKKYNIKADRLAHFPYGDRALLDNPHIVQFEIDKTPRHIYADSGWLYNDSSKVLLTGNVRVIQSHTAQAGGIATARKMVINLNEDRG